MGISRPREVESTPFPTIRPFRKLGLSLLMKLPRLDATASVLVRRVEFPLNPTGAVTTDPLPIDIDVDTDVKRALGQDVEVASGEGLAECRGWGNRTGECEGECGGVRGLAVGRGDVICEVCGGGVVSGAPIVREGNVISTTGLRLAHEHAEYMYVA